MHLPLPSLIMNWLISPAATQIGDEFKYRQDGLTLCSADIANLRASIKSQRMTDRATIISAALQIDAALEAWALAMSSQNSYDSVFGIENSNECLESFYHVYEYLWTAQVWNSYRLLRLLIHHIVLAQLGQPSSLSKPSDQASIVPQFDRSKSLAIQLCSDICASVPYMLDSFPDKSTSLHPSMQRSLGGLMLLWPLYAGVCMTPCVDERMRQWAIGRLQYIDSIMGIKQAGLMAATLLR